MIPVHYCRLHQRETSGDNRGFQSDFETVLTIIMLHDDQEYLASEIAQRICTKEKDPKRYKALNLRIYQRGYRRGLTDQFDHHGNKRREKATWPGRQWKGSINDREWFIAVGFFEHLKARQQQHQVIGNQNIHFYYDHVHGFIESDIPHLELIEALAPQSNWPQQPFYRKWMVTTILRQDLNADQKALVAKFEQPIAIEPEQPAPTKQKTPTSNHSVHWFAFAPHVRAQLWFKLVLANFAAIALLFVLRLPTHQPASEYARFVQYQQMEGQAAVQGFERMLQDPDSTLDKTWVIQALVDKLAAAPSAAHIARLRELYRLEHADRADITATIARMHEMVFFDPLFVANSKQPRMVCAIAENPMVVFDEGMLRPGDWINVDDVTGYIKEIYPDQMVVQYNGLEEDLNFDRPVIFKSAFRSNGSIIIYSQPQNLKAVLGWICAVENIELYADNLSGYILGVFPFDNYADFIDFLAQNVDLSLDANTLIVHPNQNPIIIIHASNIQMRNWSLSTFFSALSAQTGIQFYLPRNYHDGKRYYINTFDWETLFETLDWSYTYDHDTKSVRAVIRER